MKAASSSCRPTPAAAEQFFTTLKTLSASVAAGRAHGPRRDYNGTTITTVNLGESATSPQSASGRGDLRALFDAPEGNMEIAYASPTTSS